MTKRWLAIREKSIPVLRRSFIVWTLVIAALVLFFCKPSWFWPGGLGFDKGETVTTERVEKDAKGIPVKTTTKRDDGKTLWDWMSLLGVPFSLALFGFWFQQNQQKRAEEVAKEQKIRDERIAQENRERDQKIALELRERDEKLAIEQREIAAGETKEEILQRYFDRLSVLLVDKNLLAISSKVYATETPETEGQPKIEATLEERELLDSAVDVIRARTLSILRRFKNDPERKTSVIRFLIEADIVSKLKLSLSGADMSGANLFAVDLSGANLRVVDLSGANLTGANLSGADLMQADLSGADLNGACLKGTCLMLANLSGVNLKFADLFEAEWLGAKFDSANLSGARFRNRDLTEVEKSYFQGQGAKLVDPPE